MKRSTILLLSFFTVIAAISHSFTMRDDSYNDISYHSKDKKKRKTSYELVDDESSQQKQKIVLQEETLDEKKIADEIKQKHFTELHNHLNKYEGLETWKEIFSQTLDVSLNFYCQDEESNFETILRNEQHVIKNDSQNWSLADQALFMLQMSNKRTILDDIIIGALWLDTIIQRNDDESSVIFLGRSPGHIKTAYEELIKYRTKNLNNQENLKNLIEVSFSGTPGIAPIRTASDYQDKDSENKKNTLTKNRLEFYFNYLKSLGVSEVKDTLYIVDMIGTGASLNSFFQILTKFFESEKKEMPKIIFVGLSLPRMSVLKKNNWPLIFDYDHKNGIISYEENKNFNVCALSIKAYAIQLSQITLEMFLDHHYYQTLSNKTIYFPAGRWHESSSDELKNGNECYKDFKEILQKKVSDRIKDILFTVSQHALHISSN